jgi:hypothetical protein
LNGKDIKETLAGAEEDEMRKFKQALLKRKAGMQKR